MNKGIEQTKQEEISMVINNLRMELLTRLLIAFFRASEMLN